MTTIPPARTSSLGESAVARQPIYDANLNVAAYELLFRRAGDTTAVIDDPDEATSQTLMNAFVDTDLQALVSGRLAFVNVTRSFVLQDLALLARAERMGLELLEDVEIDRELVDALRRLASDGYVIALDDFVYRDELVPVLELAHVVKLDALALGEDGLAFQLELLRPFDVWVVAEKVETHEEFDACKRLGCTHFQGNFFCRPKVVPRGDVGASRLAKIQLVASLQHPSLELEDLEEIIERDIGLSYRLLRYINSAFFYLPRRVESIRDAMMVVGKRRVQSWATLIVLADLKPRPSELFVTAMVRARMCESLAVAAGLTVADTPGADTFFTTGLFSVVDALVDLPMEKALERLPFSDEIVEALLGGAGRLADVLRASVAYSLGDFDGAVGSGFAPEQLAAAYRGAVGWADSMSDELHAAAA
jgi:EAL and modified HD-GYP domain-containing signal transduction protein